MWKPLRLRETSTTSRDTEDGNALHRLMVYNVAINMCKTDVEVKSDAGPYVEDERLAICVETPTTSRDIADDKSLCPVVRAPNGHHKLRDRRGGQSDASLPSVLGWAPSLAFTASGGVRVAAVGRPSEPGSARRGSWRVAPIKRWCGVLQSFAVRSACFSVRATTRSMTTRGTGLDPWGCVRVRESDEEYEALELRAQYDGDVTRRFMPQHGTIGAADTGRACVECSGGGVQGAGPEEDRRPPVSLLRSAPSAKSVGCDSMSYWL